MKISKIGKRMLLWFLFVSVLPLILVTELSFSLFEHALKENIIQHLIEISDKKTKQINVYLDEQIKHVTILAQTPTVIDAIEAYTQTFNQSGIDSAEYLAVDQIYCPYFNNYKEVSGYYDFFLISSSGDIVFSVDKEDDFGTNLRTGSYRDTELARMFEHSQTLSETKISEFEYYTPSKEHAFFIAAPVLNLKNGELIGVVALQMDNKEIYAVVGDEAGLGETGETVVAVKKDMNVLFMAPLKYDPDAAFNRRIALGSEAALPMQLALKNQQGVGISRDYRGEPVLAVWRVLPGLRWGMVVKVDTVEAFAQVAQMRTVTFWMVLAVLGVVIGVALYLAGSIVKPIRALTTVTTEIASGNLNRRAEVLSSDEIGQLAHSFNTMTDKLKMSYEQIAATAATLKMEEALRKAKDELEIRVEERTAELKAANEQLKQLNKELERSNSLQQASLKQLRHTQAQLVESEKMAALGGLVAGVAHEINTPVGVGVTAASHLAMRVEEYTKRYNAKQLTRGDFEVFLQTALESSNMVVSNLCRAADLIRNFKQIAVDQSSEKQRVFKLGQYLEETLQSLRPKFKRTQHVIKIDCPDDLTLYSYPGAFSQIITNLLMNSLIHGFENHENGEIVMTVTRQDDDVLFLQYTDNGKGIEPDKIHKIFEPFFTTKRGLGGSGLGLHIIYNLITRTLGGHIECLSTLGQGTTFQLWIPIK